MKTTAVIVSGAPEGDNLREIEIEPGTSAGDVLRALNLNGYLLSREGSAQAFAAEEDLYAAIDDGMKLRATPQAEVGGGFWEWLLVGLGILTERPIVRRRPVQPQAARPAPPRVSLPTPRAGGRGITVARDRRALWQVRGWRREGQRLLGAYRTPRGSFVGEIALNGARTPQFFILNPPRALLTGGHAACFRSRGRGKYYVHFGRANADVDAGIVALEKLIVKALA